MKNNLDYNIALLLTSCINPRGIHSVVRSDPLTRLNDYLKSIKYYLRIPSIGNIVYCDNSGVDLSDIQEAARLNNPYDKNFEVLSFYGQPENPEFGKGYGEMRIINHALDHSNIIRESGMIMKVTGRLIIVNSESITKAISKANNVDVFCDLRSNLSTSDSRLFCATPYFLRKYFLPFQEIMNESNGICFEDVLARGVHRAMADGLRWSMLPYAHDMRGMSGTADKPIPSSRWNFMSRELFRIIKTMVLSR